MIARQSDPIYLPCKIKESAEKNKKTFQGIMESIMRKTRGTYTVAVQGALKVILGNDRMKAMALTVVLQCKLRGKDLSRQHASVNSVRKKAKNYN